MSRKTFRHKPRRLSAMLAALFLASSTLTTSEANSTLAEKSDIETAVCGWFREPFVFWLWRALAGSVDPQRVAGIKDVETIQFKTRDGTSLSGYKLRAAKPKGYLLVAQGNAMLATTSFPICKCSAIWSWTFIFMTTEAMATRRGKAGSLPLSPITLRSFPI